MALKISPGRWGKTTLNSNSSRGSQAKGHYPPKPSENPADPCRALGETPQNPRTKKTCRALWETPAEPSERQLSSESLFLLCPLGFSGVLRANPKGAEKKRTLQKHPLGQVFLRATPSPLLCHWEIKRRFRKRVILVIVCPRSGFRSRGTCERTLVPVFVPGEQKPPFRKPPFCEPPTLSGVAPANQTKERAKTKSSGISPIFVNSGVFPWENKRDSHRTFVPVCPREKFMNWPFFGLVCRGDSWLSRTPRDVWCNRFSTTTLARRRFSLQQPKVLTEQRLRWKWAWRPILGSSVWTSFRNQQLIDRPFLG